MLDFEKPILKTDKNNPNIKELQKTKKPHYWNQEPRITSLSIVNNNWVSFMNTKNYRDFKCAFELIQFLVAYDNVEDQYKQKQESEDEKKMFHEIKKFTWQKVRNHIIEKLQNIRSVF